MKAIVRDTYGPPDVLRLDDVPTPTVGDDDVLIASYEPAGEVPIGTFELPTPSAAELKRRERMAREG